MSARITVVSESPTIPTAISATDFLRDGWTDQGTAVINLCSDLRYGTAGYYVSLLAEARGLRALPSVDTLELLADGVDALRTLADAGVPVASSALGPGQEVRGVMGACLDPSLTRLVSAVHRVFPAPILYIGCVRYENRWSVSRVAVGHVEELSEQDRAFLFQRLGAEQGHSPPSVARTSAGFAVAVLFDEADPFKASDAETVDRFARVAARYDLRVERIHTDELVRLAEFDGLFIRTLTGPDTPAFAFARRAAAFGMPVIDHPRAILRAGNKAFLAEALRRAEVPVPKTMFLTPSSTYDAVAEELGTPFIVKLPDGSFSTAVHQVHNREKLAMVREKLGSESPMLVGQAWVPSDYDWRVGVLDGRPIFGCRYHMVKGHWQIRKQGPSGATRDGRTEAVPLEQVPRAVRWVAAKAARVLGDGLFGVDLKETRNGPVVLEVNDNPDIYRDGEAGAEGDRVFEALSEWFVDRIDRDRYAMRRATRRPGSGPREYRAFEVVGLELEYVIVDDQLRPIHGAETLLRALAGRPASDASLGPIGVSNEFFQHIIEVKNEYPLGRMSDVEGALVEGVGRVRDVLQKELGARLLPTGMHPFFDPRGAKRWTRSGRPIYEAYARLFDTQTHGWANVQSCQVNLPMGREHEAVAMMNATALVVPYLPALAASSPFSEGKKAAWVDHRIEHLIEHQSRLPESLGELVPEYLSNYGDYRRNVLAPMYAAVDRLTNARTLRHEWLNARAAVFKPSRSSMEVRVLDTQECILMDVAIAAFVRGCVADLAKGILRARLDLPPHELLVDDLRSCARFGSEALVFAPHVLGVDRDDEGRVSVRVVLAWLLERAARRLKGHDLTYLDEIERVRTAGTLSERILHEVGDAGEKGIDRVYRELAEALEANRPWVPRGPREPTR